MIMRVEPTTITAEERATFLQHIRDGCDRSSAAQKTNPEYTGSHFRGLSSPTSNRYDHEFAEAYDQACLERGPLKPVRDRAPTPEPRRYTAQGYLHWKFITEDMQHQFLEDTANGVPMVTAAAKLEPATNLLQLQRLARNNPEFAEKFLAAKAEGYPIFKENLRAETIRQAFNGNWPALESLNKIHLEEFAKLITSKHQIETNLNIKDLAQTYFKELPAGTLEQVIALLENSETQEAA